MIKYKFANEIFILQKHLDNNYKQLWNEWNEQEKDGHEVNRQATKKGLALLYQFIFVSSLIIVFLTKTIIFSKSNLKRI